MKKNQNVVDAQRKEPVTDMSTCNEQCNEQPQEQKINLEQLTPEQALSLLTNTARQIPLTYAEHVKVEEARQLVAQAVGITA